MELTGTVLIFGPFEEAAAAAGLAFARAWAADEDVVLVVGVL